MFSFFKKKTKNENSSAVKQTPKNEAVQAVMEKTGWSYKHTIDEIEKARARTGMSYKDYNRYGFYDIPENMQIGEYRHIQNRKIIRKELMQKCIDSAADYNGWESDFAEKQVKEARKRLGISYKDYLEYKFYELSENEQTEKYNEIMKKRALEKVENDRESRKKREKIIAEVMEATGWTHDFAQAEIKEARKRTGCTYNEYNMYKFYEMDKTIQNDTFLMELSKKLDLKYTPGRDFGKMLCNKAETNVFFDKYVRRTCCVNTDIAFEEFRQKFASSGRIVYKPLGEHGAHGIKGFDIDPDNCREVYDEIIAYPEGVVEQYVVQHTDMNALSPTAVNTVRVVTISSNSQPVTADGRKLDIAYASLKIGGVNSSIADNLRVGGLVAAIDLESGKLITDGVDEEGNSYSVHPVTGTTIKGYNVPYFKETINMVKEAIINNALEGYLGWDIAIAPDGPVLIETNLKPGVILFTMPYAVKQVGMKHVMEKYL